MIKRPRANRNETSRLVKMITAYDGRWSDLNIKLHATPLHFTTPSCTQPRSTSLSAPPLMPRPTLGVQRASLAAGFHFRDHEQDHDHDHDHDHVRCADAYTEAGFSSAMAAVTSRPALRSEIERETSTVHIG